MLSQTLSFWFLALYARVVLGQPGLTAQLFQVSGESDVNNVKLAWGPVNASSYEVQRGIGSGAYNTIATVAGDTYDDYDLDVGTTYYYQITSGSDQSDEVEVTTFTPSESYQVYDNTQASELILKSLIEADGIYYRYQYYEANQAFVITEQTSSDGYTFSGNQTVLTSDTVCAPINATCHLERISFNQHPDTGEVVMWGHLENTENYNLAQVAAAHAVPGQNFTFDGTYRPLGHDSRDLTFFADDDADHTAYIISSTNTNTDMNIYKLTANWTYVDSLTATILQSQYREAPSMVKRDGSYYLFTSRASGWYPSTPNYVTSSSISEGWSEPRVIGNIATFASQSGSTVLVGSQYVMQADRWGANWAPADPPNRQLMLPLSFAPSGQAAADYHFYRQVKYQDATDSENVFGVQAGRKLSVGKNITTTPAGGSDLSFANDGTEDNVDEYFVPASVPFSMEIDLGAQCAVAAVDLTVRMYQGSETYYQYNITGSADGADITLLADETNNTAVGFVSSGVNDGGQYRYVTLNVNSVTNTHNGNEADWAVGIQEITVYGT